MTGRIGSALPCDCGHPYDAHTGPAGSCVAPVPEQPRGGRVGSGDPMCPCDGYGITLDADASEAA